MREPCGLWEPGGACHREGGWDLAHIIIEPDTDAKAVHSTVLLTELPIALLCDIAAAFPPVKPHMPRWILPASSWLHALISPFPFMGGDGNAH